MATDRVRGWWRRAPIGLSFFLVPFLLAGLAAVVIGIGLAVKGQWPQGLALAAFGVVFLAFPCGLAALLLYSRREERRRAEQRAANPGRPWLWRDDFARGVLPAKGEAGLLFITGFSLFWNAAALAGAVLAVREYAQKGDWRILLILIFPLFGAGLLYWALAQTLRWLRFRRCVFHMSAAPAAIGGSLKGVVLIPPRLDPAAGFEVKLSCLRRTHGSDDTQEHILWEAGARVPGPVPSYPEALTAVPVSIPIPPECEPWNDESADRQVIWRLRVSAAVPGADLNLIFEVPVFRTLPEDPSQPRETLPDGFIRPASRGEAPAPSRVRIVSVPGGTQFILAPPGGAASALGCLLSLAFTVAVAMVISKAGAPLIFPLVAGLFGMIVVLALLWAAAGEVRLTMGSDGVVLTYRLLGFQKSWKAPPGEVLEAGISVMAQTNQNPSYGIMLRRRVSKPLIVFAMLRDKSQADWLASEFNRRLNFQNPRPSRS